MADRFRYQVIYFAVRGKIALIKRAAQRLSSIEKCWQVKILEPLTVGQMGINYPDCASLDVLHKNKGPSLVPCGTPAQTGFQLDLK